MCSYSFLTFLNKEACQTAAQQEPKLNWNTLKDSNFALRKQWIWGKLSHGKLW